MYSYLSGDVLSRAGNFSLNSVNLVSYQGVDGTSQPFKLSITTLVTEINIYESIFKSNTINIANNTPIIFSNVNKLFDDLGNLIVFLTIIYI